MVITKLFFVTANLGLLALVRPGVFLRNLLRAKRGSILATKCGIVLCSVPCYTDLVNANLPCYSFLCGLLFSLVLF